MFKSSYASVFEGDDELARRCQSPTGETVHVGPPTPTYVKNPPYFDGIDA